jgi:hypothetical protein
MRPPILTDTVLPPKIRRELSNQSGSKIKRIIGSTVLVVILLAGLRHLNTVPQREWTEKWTINGRWEEASFEWSKKPGADGRYTRIDIPSKWVDGSDHNKRVYTIEGLFGSYTALKKMDTALGNPKISGVFSCRRLATIQRPAQRYEQLIGKMSEEDKS